MNGPELELTCPACAEPVWREDRFCEACGTALPAPPPPQYMPSQPSPPPVPPAPPVPPPVPPVAVLGLAGWPDPPPVIPDPLAWPSPPLVAADLRSWSAPPPATRQPMAHPTSPPTTPPPGVPDPVGPGEPTPVDPEPGVPDPVGPGEPPPGVPDPLGPEEPTPGVPDPVGPEEPTPGVPDPAPVGAVPDPVGELAADAPDIAASSASATATEDSAGLLDLTAAAPDAVGESDLVSAVLGPAGSSDLSPAAPEQASRSDPVAVVADPAASAETGVREDEAAPGTEPEAPEQEQERERVEIVDGPVVGITDRGSDHSRNEDAVGAYAVDGEPGGFVLVVCDGVSARPDSQLVSQAAVDAALPILRAAVAADADLELGMMAAAAAAQKAVVAAPYDPEVDVVPGSSTLVAVAVRGNRATFGSVGDSRAYWIDADGAVQIGRDDSLAAELVASGRVTAEQAMASPGAHAITKWLGVDAEDPTPRITSLELPGPGLVLLMSDGLWNHVPDAHALAQLVGPLGSEPPLELARRLATFAEGAGGTDNVTVAIGPHRLDDLDRPEVG